MHVDIYHKGSNRVVAMLTKRLTAQCARINVPLTFGPASPPKADRRIAVVLARKGNTWTEPEEAEFKRLVGERVAVLPVVSDPPAAQFLPKELSHINAFITGFFGNAWAECLADEVLGLAWLHRRTPKVFISYKRTDSGPIAAQLYDRFNRLGYETFFDEASVPRGADFQRELKWWLNDADLLVVLASPRFPESRWCMEEVSFCQQRFVGVAAIEWPRQIYEGAKRIRFPGVTAQTKPPIILARPQPSQILTLTADDYAGAPVRPGGRDSKLPERELTPEGLGKVLKLCARQRTVAIRQRLDNLIPLARELLGASPVGGSFTATDLTCQTNGVRSFVRVLPFRPTPENIRQAAVEGAKEGKIAGCFYEENDPFDLRAEALRWLANGTRKPVSNVSDGWLWASCGGALL